jgi:uncharacterized membrane protein YdjX (TVP38/TMEM64 family)
MRRMLVPIVLIAVVLAIPILPFAGFGAALEAEVERWLDAALPPQAIAALVIGVLATDVFLPVPSSVLNTFAGEALGFWLGTAAAWVGLTLGAVWGFALARVFGRPLAARLSDPADLQRMADWSRRFGPAVLVVTRPVPVFAEATVLFLGTSDMRWSAMVLPVALSNLGLAAAYAALGHWVQLPVALAASIVLPLAAAAVMRWGVRGGRVDGG